MSPVFDLFSKRKKAERGEFPDVYQYIEFEETLKIQIVHIIKDAFGEDFYRSEASAEAYKFVKDTLCREYGVFEIIPNPGRMEYKDQVFKYFLQEQDIEKCLDIVELCFRLINSHMRKYDYTSETKRKIDPNEAIKELNMRFKEHGFGYQFEAGIIMKIDSEYIHSEIIKQALSLLSTKEFKGANQEFILAHEHYRAGRNKEWIVNT